MIDKGKYTECNDFKDPWRKSGNDRKIDCRRKVDKK